MHYKHIVRGFATFNVEGEMVFYKWFTLHPISHPVKFLFTLSSFENYMDMDTLHTFRFDNQSCVLECTWGDKLTYPSPIPNLHAISTAISRQR